MATLSAILTAREKALDWVGKEQGLAGQPVLRVYTGTQSHSSVEKAVFLAGIGRDNLVKVPVDEDGAMRPDALREAIAADRDAGYRPALFVVSSAEPASGRATGLTRSCRLPVKKGFSAMSTPPGRALR